MTKPRRDELRDLYKIATEPYTDDDTLDDVMVKHRQRGEAYGLLAGKLVAALPELLDSDERLEAVREWRIEQYRTLDDPRPPGGIHKAFFDLHIITDGPLAERKVSKSETLCEHCKGYGEEWLYVTGLRAPNPTRCPECNGTGKVAAKEEAWRDS